ncbi:hypothetical protein TIFTF001_025867 [Ficus carica]|uniref:Uncharacterized protein n=1 Tax=Ficus carica TaxID=3494 RepID=A0AA88B1N5_FICCA|nr:hypothetical protein TIFTF001_025867 [Ficus carica]
MRILLISWMKRLLNFEEAFCKKISRLVDHFAVIKDSFLGLVSYPSTGGLVVSHDISGNTCMENGHCGKEQDRNEIVGGGAWSSCTGEVLQQLGFDNSLSSSDVVVYPPSALVVYPSDLSLDGVLVLLELLLCGVSSDPCTSES